MSYLAHLFLPRESNNYKAKILHHSSIFSFIGFVLLTQLVLSAFLVAKPSVLGFASRISPERIIELTNLERSKVGAPALGLNPLLSEAALRKAGDMFAFSYWAHNSPSGRDPWSFLKEVGYRYLYAGENLARDFASPEAVVGAWMASPTHRENLLNPKYQEIGLSVVDGTLNGAQTTLVVQLFGTLPGAQIAQLPPKAAAVTNQEKLSPAILSQAKGTEKALINPFSLTKEGSFLLLFLLIGVIVLDGIVFYRKRVLRLSGKSLAHFLFLGGVFLIVWLSAQGAIL